MCGHAQRTFAVNTLYVEVWIHRAQTRHAVLSASHTAPMPPAGSCPRSSLPRDYLCLFPKLLVDGLRSAELLCVRPLTMSHLELHPHCQVLVYNRLFLSIPNHIIKGVTFRLWIINIHIHHICSQMGTIALQV